jgi:glycine betaine/choline ABC-type transport system substrate-binding protein
MKTFNIQISAEQLDIIKLALELQIGMSESNDIVITENDIEETNMLIGMIDDVIEEDDTETTHGFCY